MKRAVALAVVLAALASPDALARKGGMGESRDARESRETFEQRGLFATGLTPLFPEGVECPGISSSYGSPARYDGSPRNNDHHGLHNGMDISLEAGTPLLAIADGEVVHAGTAGQLVGNFIWLRFGPGATGLPVYVFAKYQHLDQPATLKPGDGVKQGQTIGQSGLTGTTGGHYGTQGYPHLHINLLISQEPDFTVMGPMVRLNDGFSYLDPMGLYAQRLEGPFDNRRLRDLPEAQKNFPVSVMTGQGKLIFAGPKPIWPVACREK